MSKLGRPLDDVFVKTAGDALLCVGQASLKCQRRLVRCDTQQEPIGFAGRSRCCDPDDIAGLSHPDWHCRDRELDVVNADTRPAVGRCKTSPPSAPDNAVSVSPG
ncbi:hypothetical protein NKH14_01290 [Mesorhizobium sp. M1380]|uniref:hypothetical protein n=1 Tax=Mesorhizobium sp. M1380 TaxID=2957093 RepID=UPI003336FE94